MLLSIKGFYKEEEWGNNEKENTLYGYKYEYRWYREGPFKYGSRNPKR